VIVLILKLLLKSNLPNTGHTRLNQLLITRFSVFFADTRTHGQNCIAGWHADKQFRHLNCYICLTTNKIQFAYTKFVVG